MKPSLFFAKFILLACLFTLLASGLYAFCCVCNYAMPYSNLGPIGLILLSVWHILAIASAYISASEWE